MAIKVKQRVPTSQYAYMEYTKEYESEAEALIENREMVSMYEDQGLPPREWAQVRNKMFQTGHFDPNIENLSRLQRFFINECKKSLRALDEENNPTIT